MSRGCQLQGQLLPGQFINTSDTLFVFCVTGIFLSLISTSEVDFCVWTSVLQKQKQTLPLSLLPSGPQFTEGPVQDPHFPELISAYVSHFPINLIHIFSAINSFEKEILHPLIEDDRENNLEKQTGFIKFSPGTNNLI